jgi:GTP-binding protein Era
VHKNNPKAEDPAASFRSGLVGIIGRSNVGKSTLLNKLIGQKLSIVTPKPHTTRHNLLGVLNSETAQIGLIDTPGYLGKGRDSLDAIMIGHLREALSEADLVALVVEPRSPGTIELQLINQIKDLGTPSIVVINKVDSIRKSGLLPVLEAYSNSHEFLEIVPVSALKGDGLDLLVKLLGSHLPEQGELFEQSFLTDKSLLYLLGEAIREQIYIQYRMEIPYAVAIEIEQFEQREGNRPDYLLATIFVEKPSQRRLVIGQGGGMLKEIGISARKEIEKMSGRPVFLDLWVKVKPRWREDPQILGQVL